MVRATLPASSWTASVTACEGLVTDDRPRIREQSTGPNLEKSSMFRTNALLQSALLSIGLLAQSAAADVWIVTKAYSGAPGEFTEIQPAIDAASDGDVILLRNGSYRPFTIDGKGLTLIEDFGQISVRITGGEVATGVSRGDRSRIQNLRAEQTCTLRSLTIEGLELRDNAGAVWLEDLRIEKRSPACIIEDCARAVLIGTRIEAESAAFDSAGSPIAVAGVGLRVTDSHVAMGSADCLGGNGSSAFVSRHGIMIPATAGAPAISMLRGTLLVRSSALRGGNGGAGLQPVGSASCASGANGAVALELQDAAVRLLGGSALGGIGGAAPTDPSNCGAGLSAAPTKVVGGALSVTSATSRSLIADSPVREGAKGFLFVGGKTGDVVLVRAATRTSVGPVAGLGPVSMLAPNAATVGVFVIPQFVGFLAVNSAPLTLPPAVDSVELFLEAGFCDPQGCDLVFGSTLTILDSRFPLPERYQLPGPAGN